MSLWRGELAKLIRDWVTAGVNSYNAWNMVLDTVGKSLDGWPQDALLVVDRTAKTLTATAAYYAFRHFSRPTSFGRHPHRDAGDERCARLQEPRRERHRGGLQQGLLAGGDHRGGGQRPLADALRVHRPCPWLGDPPGHALTSPERQQRVPRAGHRPRLGPGAQDDVRRHAFAQDRRRGPQIS